MDRELACSKKNEAVKEFALEGEIVSINSYGSGHINDTFLLEEKEGNGVKKYILQRINHEIFKKPEELMENIEKVTSYLKGIIEKRGGDANRETLSLVLTRTGKAYYKDELGSYWRVYKFIEGARTYDKVDTKKDFYESAFAFGNFQNLLADFDASKLHETIPAFHDTKQRFKVFKEAVLADIKKRAQSVKEEIDFVLSHEYLANKLTDMQDNKELPLRVTHNDTKLNNIMIDDATRKAICVIDLDTVMPGLAVNDFGDSIRFGANTADEDEPDTKKVSLDLDLFEAYVKGFTKGCKGSLTDRELDMLPYGAMVMTFECGMRFLTDYLQGDTYFKISRPQQNLDRARCQFALVKDMEEKIEQMNEIINRYR